MNKRKTYKNKIGDGQLPNLYWITVSNDYAYIHDSNCIDWVGDLILLFKSKGKTIAKPFKTYAAAKRYCDYEFTLGETCSFGFIVNRINIEDRLSGQLYEKTRIFDPDTADVRDWECEDTGFTKETMEERGVNFR